MREEYASQITCSSSHKSQCMRNLAILVVFQRSDSAMHLAAFEGFTETLEILFSPELGANKFAKNEVSITYEICLMIKLGYDQAMHCKIAGHATLDSLFDASLAAVK